VAAAIIRPVNCPTRQRACATTDDQARRAVSIASGDSPAQKAACNSADHKARCALAAAIIPMSVGVFFSMMVPTIAPMILIPAMIVTILIPPAIVMTRIRPRFIAVMAPLMRQGRGRRRKADEQN
jgi:predicted metal-binding membrane protein